MIRVSVNTRITAAILAGGENKRFGGKTKALMKIDGVALITHTVDLLAGIFDDILLVTNKPQEFDPAMPVRIAGDIFKKRGPLGGLHSAINNSDSGAIFLFAGDMPFLSPELVKLMISEYAETKPDALLPERNGDIEPLHAIYNIRLKQKLNHYIEKEKRYAIRDFLKITDSEYFSLEDQEYSDVFTNINTREELEVLERKLRNND